MKLQALHDVNLNDGFFPELAYEKILTHLPLADIDVMSGNTPIHGRCSHFPAGHSFFARDDPYLR
jgi:hypothetical protein